MILVVLAGWTIGQYLHVAISGRLWGALGGPWWRRLFWPGRGGQLGLWLRSGLPSIWIYSLLLLFLRLLHQLWSSQELLECTAGWRTSLIGCEGKPRGSSAPEAEDKLIMLVTNLSTLWWNSWIFWIQTNSKFYCSKHWAMEIWAWNLILICTKHKVLKRQWPAGKFA